MRKKKGLFAIAYIPPTDAELNRVGNTEMIFCRIERKLNVLGIPYRDNDIWPIAYTRAYDGSSIMNSKKQSRIRFS